MIYSTDFSPRTTRMLRLSAAALALGALLAPDTALAEDAPSFLSQQDGNIIWTMLGAMLVMFMQPGFALVGVVDHLVRGAKIADLITIGGSLDYVVPDIDR